MKAVRDRKVSPAQIFRELPAGSLKLLQITDTHLYADASKRLAGLATDKSLQKLLSLAKERILPVDLVLVTGDLVHDATPSGYQRLRDHLLTLEAQTYCIPGNHDLNPAMEENMRCDGVSTDAISQHGNWTLIMLDSTIPGKVEGHLDDQQLELLKDGLEKHKDQHTLVALHHHPVQLGSAWIDKIGLNNANDLFAILDQHPQIRGLLWGHAHQLYDSERNGVRLMGSPSTCIQFKPDQDEFGIHHSPPGLRWLALLPDGKILSDVEYLKHTPSGLDLASSGY